MKPVQVAVNKKFSFVFFLYSKNRLLQQLPLEIIDDIASVDVVELLQLKA